MDATTLPYNLDAERAVLGSVLLNRDAVMAVDGWLLAEHFYTERHRWIYEAMQACYRRRVPPDTVAVSDELRRVGRLEQAGGLIGLIELTQAAPSSVHIEHYGRIVERTAIARKVIDASGKIAALGFDETLDLDTLGTQAQQALAAALERHGDGGPVSLAEVCDELTAEWQQDKEPGTPTGYHDLDGLIGGWQRSALVVLAARPGVGKTSLALCSSRAAADHGPVLIFSQEMDRRHLLERLTAVEVGMNAQDVHLRRLSDDDYQRAAQAWASLSRLPIAIDDTPAQAITALQRKAMQFAARNGTPALIVVDYLQLSRGADKRERNREQEVGEISRGLKAMARMLNAPVLALSQLSRAVEGRSVHIPLLSDLRESGSIEQDADVVIFIHREELYDKESDKKGIAELHIAKHRAGPTGVVPLRFDAITTGFYTLEKYRDVEGF